MKKLLLTALAAGLLFNSPAKAFDQTTLRGAAMLMIYASNCTPSGDLSSLPRNTRVALEILVEAHASDIFRHGMEIQKQRRELGNEVFCVVARRNIPATLL